MTFMKQTKFFRENLHKFNNGQIFKSYLQNSQIAFRQRAAGQPFLSDSPLSGNHTACSYYTDSPQACTPYTYTFCTYQLEKTI